MGTHFTACYLDAPCELRYSDKMLFRYYLGFYLRASTIQYTSNFKLVCFNVFYPTANAAAVSSSRGSILEL